MRIRRHQMQGFDWNRILPSRLPLFRWDLVRRHPKLAAAVVVFGGALAAGYLLAALVFFPAPFFVRTRTVPNLVGRQQEDARRQLEDAGLQWRLAESAPHVNAPRGTVVWQDPPPGVVAPQGTEISLSVSEGVPRVPVPDVAGYDEPLARALIDGANLEVSAVETAQTDSPKGVAVNTRPPAGTTVPRGAGITLVLSAGAPTITVPDLNGLTLDSAQARLEEQGLKLGTHYFRSVPGRPGGTVIEQRPRAGTLIAPGSVVTLVLAQERI